jgi:hypothetical protein
MPNPYRSEDEIEAVVRGFELCTTKKDDFTHREHLIVAVWYLHRSDHQQALEQMRNGLLRFLKHHGVGSSKYKESLTVSWLALVETTLAELDPRLSLLEATNIIIERLGDPRLVEPAKGV